MRPQFTAVVLTAATIFLLGGCALLVPAQQQLSQVDTAADAQARSDVANAKVAFLTYEITNSAAPTSAADLGEFGYQQSDGVSEVRIYPASTSSALCLDVQSSSGAYFKATASGTVADGECATSDL